MASLQTKKRLALAIIDFLSTSLKDGTLTAEDSESIEIAQSCIADTFKVDANDKQAVQEAIGGGGQSLLSIYAVYEKLKGKSTPSTTGPSSASEGRPSTPATASTDVPKSPSTTINPEAETLKSQGNAAMAKKDYASAVDSYTKALEISPLNPIYLSNRAAAYSASGKHSQAAADAEMAVAADPKYVKAWSRLGLAKFALGDAKGSMEAYQQGIKYEGGGGSEAMRKGLETAKAKVEELEKEGDAAAENAQVDDATRGSPAGAGGMPDLSGLASMLGGGRGGGGGGGMPDLGSLMNNPMFASMAQNVMNNPDMLNNIMSNPRIRQMAEQFGGGGQGGQGGSPDVASLMSDPSIAEMARNLMGNGRGAGR